MSISQVPRNKKDCLISRWLPTKCSLRLGVTVGIDVTARDLQRYEKEHSLPWTLSKAQATFCPLAPDLLTYSDSSELNCLGNRHSQLLTPLRCLDGLVLFVEVGLRKGDTVVQNDTAQHMIFKVRQAERIRDLCYYLSFQIPQLLSYLSTFVALRPGDVILTGKLLRYKKRFIYFFPVAGICRNTFWCWSNDARRSSRVLGNIPVFLSDR